MEVRPSIPAGHTRKPDLKTQMGLYSILRDFLAAHARTLEGVSLSDAHVFANMPMAAGSEKDVPTPRNQDAQMGALFCFKIRMDPWE